MRKIIKRLLPLALTLLAVPSAAQGQRKAIYVHDYDLTSTSYIFCVTTGQNGSPFGAPIPGLGNAGTNANIETVGSSTTVTAVTANALPFRDLAVGDDILVNIAGTFSMRVITAKASGDSVTVNSAIDLDITGGYPFTWRKRTCGTAATDGWIDVGPYSDFDITFWIQTLNATSIDVLAECEAQAEGSAPTQVFPPNPTGSGICETGNFTAAQTRACTINSVGNNFDRCRIGYKINTDTGAQDISAWIAARARP